MRLFGFMGNIIFGLLGLAMAAFYFGVLNFWSGDDGPGTPEKVTVGVLAALWLLGAVKRFTSGFKAVMPPPREARSVGATVADEPSGFDAEAALERYMANRSAEPASVPAASAPRGFGRRGL